MATTASPVMATSTFVPPKDKNYVPWGEFNSIKTIIDSRKFFPVYISGFSGNGKTVMVEQACARTNREYLRVQISPETDEDDLIGGFRLLNGETVFTKGPVITAMERGAILLIDELDRGTNKIMCLQGVLEGKPILIKKTGELVSPAPGFNVFATANTKGQGSEDGRYAAAQVIDDAFIERFLATIDQPFADVKIERQILTKHMESEGKPDEDFAERLIEWASVVRKTYEEGAISELISTRRLCHVARAYSVFGDRKKAIKMCIERYDKETSASFLELYEKIDAALTKKAQEAAERLRREKEAAAKGIDLKELKKKEADPLADYNIVFNSADGSEVSDEVKDNIRQVLLKYKQDYIDKA